MTLRRVEQAIRKYVMENMEHTPGGTRVCEDALVSALSFWSVDDMVLMTAAPGRALTGILRRCSAYIEPAIRAAQSILDSVTTMQPSAAATKSIPGG